MMKTKITIIVALVFTGLLISSSCKKIEDKISEKLSPAFQADVDGTTWKTSAVTAVKSDSGFTVTAMEDSVYFMIFLSEFKDGKYSINQKTAAATYTKGESSNIHVAYEGEIEIIESQDKGLNFDMKFHYNAINILGDTVSITNGKAVNIINPI